jgi:peptidyl-prolyl cis-trans isomerase C
MIKAPGVTVNNVKISPEQINAEAQYHPSESMPEAKYQAMQALVIRELLIQEAICCNLCTKDLAYQNPDEAIETLLNTEIKVPEPDIKSCKRYFENNKARFVTAPLFEVSHIFFPAPPGEKRARDNAKKRALAALRIIHDKPSSFNKIAKKESSCASAVKGGRLGQITKGQTVPAFEDALMKMKEGEVSAEPVETEVGFHIIKVHKRIDGENLPFDVVHEWIAHYLSEQSWNRAVSQYIKILASKAEIIGFHFNASEGVLVQ